MSEARVFFDTNILLYLLSHDETKASKTEQLLAAGGTISVQVLNEITQVAKRKIGLDWQEIEDLITSFIGLFQVTPLTLETHLTGRRLAERFSLSVYDAMIVSAALEAECTILYSEDMQHGQVFEGSLRVVNPFEQ
ncbi:MAG: hypothetical protein RL497_1110 [Pseudomonadota bacterium]